MWCSSGIIFDSCCDGDLWLVQVKYVPFAPVLKSLETGNYHHQVLKLEPLEVLHHRQLFMVLGSVVLIHVLFIPIIILFISLVKLLILFLSMVETLVIVSGR